MAVKDQILECLASGPKTSTEIANEINLTRGTVKVALVTMVKKNLVRREKVERLGKGPKSQYCYTLGGQDEILSRE